MSRSTLSSRDSEKTYPLNIRMLKQKIALFSTRLSLLCMFVNSHWMIHSETKLNGFTHQIIPHTKSNFAILSFYNQDVEKMGEAMMRSVRPYADKFEYDLVVERESRCPERHPVWSKLLAIVSLIDLNKYDWILWMDADAIITNSELPLESIIKESQADVNKHALLFTKVRYYEDRLHGVQFILGR